jgi:hypothetical protein
MSPSGERHPSPPSASAGGRASATRVSPSSRDHRAKLPSPAAGALHALRWRPSTSKRSARVLTAGGSKVHSDAASRRDHTRACSNCPAEASCSPSAEKATHATLDACPACHATRSPERRSRRSTVCVSGSEARAHRPVASTPQSVRSGWCACAASTRARSRSHRRGAKPGVTAARAKATRITRSLPSSTRTAAPSSSKQSSTTGSCERATRPWARGSPSVRSSTVHASSLSSHAPPPQARTLTATVPSGETHARSR